MRDRGRECSSHLQWPRNVRTKRAFNFLDDMESRHHYRSKRVWRKCPINVRRSPRAAIDEITDRHDRLDKLTFQPLFNVLDYLSIDGRIASGFKLLGEESHEVTVAAEVTICLDYVAVEGIADNLSGQVVQLTFL